MTWSILWLKLTGHIFYIPPDQIANIYLPKLSIYASKKLAMPEPEEFYYIFLWLKSQICKYQFENGFAIIKKMLGM